MITALAQVLFKDKANGQIRYRNGEAIGSRIIGQPFTSAKYFHPRPSAAGNGYDAANSGGTNFGPTNQKLIDRIQADAKSSARRKSLATHSRRSDHHFRIRPGPRNFPGGGRISNSAHRPRARPARIHVRDLVQKHTYQRDLGLLGEPRVNVLELNLALDELSSKP